MSSPTLRRTTLVLLLAALFTAPWASAAGPKAPSTPKTAVPAHLDLLSRAWTLLANLWAEEGCNLDPDGRCATAVRTAPPRVHSDEGCNLDPNGRCATGPVRTAPPRLHSDTGCNLDPDGRCTP
jgi:hypothetical protein